MTPEQQAAYVISQSVSALIEAMGMTAENRHRLSVGNSVAYGEEAFQAVIERYGIQHNAILSLFGK